MRSKEVSEAINKTKQLQQFIKEKGKDFCFYDNENAVIGYECLKVVLNYISGLEEKVERFNNELDLDYVDNNFISKQVIRDKIKELEEDLKSFEETDNTGRFKREKSRDYDKLVVLKEILEGEK